MTTYAADSEGPSNLNITKYGWEIKGPFPYYFAAVAPASILKVVACSCNVPDFLCSHSTGLQCTMYCKYEGNSDYENQKRENGGI